MKNVRVIRYIRPTEIKIAEGTGTNVLCWNNLGGITLLFDLDYTLRTVSVRFSLCHDDENFVKSVGIALAEKAEVVVYDLDKFRKLADNYGGFVEAFVEIMHIEQLYQDVPGRVKSFLAKVKRYND